MLGWNYNRQLGRNNTMTDQTQALMKSLPRCASLIAAADARNSAIWRVVRWEESLPAEVAVDDVRPANDLAGDEDVVNQFDNRTKALRASAADVRRRYAKPDRTESGHWGVWRCKERDRVVYQTVLPLPHEHLGAVETALVPFVPNSAVQT